jgi:hypothetical protein
MLGLHNPKGWNVRGLCNPRDFIIMLIWKCLEYIKIERNACRRRIKIGRIKNQFATIQTVTKGNIGTARSLNTEVKIIFNKSSSTDSSFFHKFYDFLRTYDYEVIQGLFKDVLKVKDF